MVAPKKEAVLNSPADEEGAVLNSPINEKGAVLNSPVHENLPPSYRISSTTTGTPVQPPTPDGPQQNGNREQYACSRTWASPSTKEAKNWVRVVRLMRRRLNQKALVPWDFSAWIEHRHAELDYKAKRTQRLLEQKDREHVLASRGVGVLPKPFLDKEFENPEFGAVLCESTIWTNRNEHLDRYGATIWPSPDERRHEGDERMFTEFGRFFPLVRDWKPGDPRRFWHRVPLLLPLAFDVKGVNHPPTKKDIYDPRIEIFDEDTDMLLNSSILAALDEDD